MKPPDPLPSWNEGSAKQAILEFVRVTTEHGSPKYVAPEDRIVTFDQDGTLWVEQPMYAQLAFALARMAALLPEHPDWLTTEPFQALLAGDDAVAAGLSLDDLKTLIFATHGGMPVEAFHAIVAGWIGGATHPRWNRPFTDLIFQPMREVIELFRAAGYRTYIVTGGGQAFVRTFAREAYGIPPEQIIGSASETEFGYDASGKPFLMRPPKLLFFNDVAGKPQDIYLFLGRAPRAAFGNSAGDRPMLDYTQAAGGARFMGLVLHDDAQREYAYGPAAGLPDSKVGTFPQELLDEAVAKGWLVISMQRDWKRVFAFDP